MPSMSELRSYKATEKALMDRVDLLRTKQAARYTDWQDSKGSSFAGPKFDAYRKATEKLIESEQALTLISGIIKEIEGSDRKA